jgi:hypothetical protein
MVKSMSIRRVESVDRIGRIMEALKLLMGKLVGKRPQGIINVGWWII